MALRKIIDYKVIQKEVDEFNRAPLKIADQVRKDLEKGWEPYGELKCANGHYYQALVKYKGLNIE